MQFSKLVLILSLLASTGLAATELSDVEKLHNAKSMCGSPGHSFSIYLPTLGACSGLIIGGKFAGRTSGLSIGLGLAIGYTLGLWIEEFIEETNSQAHKIIRKYLNRTPKELHELLPTAVCKILEPYCGKIDLSHDEIITLMWQIKAVI